MEDNLLELINKSNDAQYINGMVTLSIYNLTNSEMSVLSKWLEFWPLQGHQILVILSKTWIFSKEE